MGFLKIGYPKKRWLIMIKGKFGYFPTQISKYRFYGSQCLSHYIPMFVWLNHQFYENHLALFVAMVFCKRFFFAGGCPCTSRGVWFYPGEHLNCR